MVAPTLTIQRLNGERIAVELTAGAEYLLVEVDGGKAWSGCGEITVREVRGSVIPKPESEGSE